MPEQDKSKALLQEENYNSDSDECSKTAFCITATIVGGVLGYYGGPIVAGWIFGKNAAAALSGKVVQEIVGTAVGACAGGCCCIACTAGKYGPEITNEKPRILTMK